MNAQTYLDRADQLARARECLQNCESCAGTTDALALVSIHAAIALNDALHIRLTEKNPKNQDHKRAADRTEAELAKRKLETDGLKHLRSLLANKTNASYGSSPVTEKQAYALARSADRFELWAKGTLEKL